MTKENMFVPYEELKRYHSVINLENCDEENLQEFHNFTSGRFYHFPKAKKWENKFSGTTLEQIIQVDLKPSRFKGEKYEIDVRPYIAYSVKNEVNFSESSNDVHSDIKSIFWLGRGWKGMANLTKLNEKIYAQGLARTHDFKIIDAFYNLVTNSISKDKDKHRILSPSDVKKIKENIEEVEKIFGRGYYEENPRDAVYAIFNKILWIPKMNQYLKYVSRKLSNKFLVGNLFNKYLRGVKRFEYENGIWKRDKDLTAILIPAPEEMINYYTNQNPVDETKEHMDYNRAIDRIPDGPL